MSSLAAQIPKTAIIIPSNMKVVGTNPLVLKKIKRGRKRGMSKAQKARIRTAAKKFKLPILTGIMIAPAVALSAQTAMRNTGLINQISAFSREMISFYTGLSIAADGRSFSFDPARLVVGWGPVAAVTGIKLIAKGRVLAINRALSRAQIPANLA